MSQGPSLEVLKEKEEKLQLIGETLKKEYAGLDQSIDEIMESVRMWYLLPEGMLRPTAVCLWGMTGVGKTSLVLRLVELLEFGKKLIFEDMGKQVSATYTPSTENLLQAQAHFSGKPVVFILDEMHTARTIDSYGNEVDRPFLRDFWTFLDSGILQRDPRWLADMRVNLCDRLRSIKLNKQQGFENQNIVSTYDVEYFRRLLGSEDHPDEIFNRATENPEKFFEEGIKIVDEIIKARPVIDLRRSLVFITGNLDELFEFTRVGDGETIHADELHKMSKLITKIQMKNVLQSKFRPEQVARMGNIHLLFPSLSEQSFRTVIKKRLAAISQFTKDSFSLELTFDQKIEDLLYREGVIPSQGCRSVLSTISEIIEARICDWVLKAKFATPQILEMTASYLESSHEITLKSNAGDMTVPLDKKKLAISMTAIPEMDETTRRIVSVHEAGHAVAGVISFGFLPKRIVLGTTIPGVKGLVQFDHFPILNKKTAEDFLIYLLGGMTAEEMVFGKALISAGCQKDLREATDLSSYFLTEIGMGHHLGVSSRDPQGMHNLTSLQPEDDKMKEEWLKKAQKKTLDLLHTHKALHLSFAEELFEKGTITRERMEVLLRQHCRFERAEIEAMFTRTKPQAFEEYEKQWISFRKPLKAA